MKVKSWILVAGVTTALLGSPRISNAAQEGVASFYHPGLEGHKMANGRPYRGNGTTVASRTLPLGSHVMIENLQNHRLVAATVADRGPYVGGRIIDLSMNLARRLHIMKVGIARVRVTLYHPAKRPERSRYTFLALFGIS